MADNCLRSDVPKFRRRHDVSIPPPKCACVDHDARRCLEIRYHFNASGEPLPVMQDDERCECSCHAYDDNEPY